MRNSRGTLNANVFWFRHNASDGSFAPLAYQPARDPMSDPAVPLVLSRITIATTCHQYGKTNLSYDGLNQLSALFPYWWVNNAKLG